MKAALVALVGLPALSLGALFVLACGSAQGPRPPPAPASDCARVADHLLSLMTDTAKDAPSEEQDKVRAMFARRCHDDGWSPQAQTCFLDLASKEQVDRCAALLTQAQRDALERPSPPAK